MPKLLFQGHGSYRLTANDGRVIYVDPCSGKGYDAPADLILVTHQHSDHNKVHLCVPKPNCRIITNKEALAGGAHNCFDIDGILIQAVEAKSKLHSPKRCVGYIITLDGGGESPLTKASADAGRRIKIYCSGDTSRTKQMDTFSALRLDYAIFPGAGLLSMGLKEASECAALIGAKHNIIIHLRPGALFDRRKAEKWDAPNRLIIEPGEEIAL